MEFDQLLKLLAFIVAVAVPILSYVAAKAGAGAAVTIHLDYLRRDVDQVSKSTRAAHWRLDEVGAPPAPSDVR